MKQMGLFLTALLLLFSLRAEERWSDSPYSTGSGITITIPAKKGETKPTALFTEESESIAITSVNQTETNITITLVPLDTGEIEIPEITLSTGTQQLTIASKKVTINAITTEQETELADVKKNAIARIDDYLPLWIGLGLLGLLACGLLLYYFIKKRKKTTPLIDRTVPPIEVGMAYYNRAKRALKDGETAPVVDNITIGVRDYLELRTDIPFLEMTTREVVRAYKNETLVPEIEKALYDMLRTGDRYKFAEERLSSQELTEMLDSFSAVLTQTETFFEKRAATEKAKKEVKDAIS